MGEVDGISIESEFCKIILPSQDTRLQMVNFFPSDNAHSQKKMCKSHITSRISKIVSQFFSHFTSFCA